MSEMHLRQPRLTYSASGPFIKNKERSQKFKETGDSPYIYQNWLDKACFQHDIAYGDFKDFTRSRVYDKYCIINHLINLNMMDINVDLLHWFRNFLIKKLLVVLLRLHGRRPKLHEINLLLKMKIFLIKNF